MGFLKAIVLYRHKFDDFFLGCCLLIFYEWKFHLFFTSIIVLTWCPFVNLLLMVFSLLVYPFLICKPFVFGPISLFTNLRFFMSQFCHVFRNDWLQLLLFLTPTMMVNWWLHNKLRKTANWLKNSGIKNIVCCCWCFFKINSLLTCVREFVLVLVM